eukprot:COSAG06_NODE_7110_length_2628_cov_39.368921_1_plen_74_part_10
MNHDKTMADRHNKSSSESVQLDRDALDRADSSNTTGGNTTGSSKTDSKTKKPHGETAQQRPETTREPLDVAFRP